MQRLLDEHRQLSWGQTTNTVIVTVEEKVVEEGEVIKHLRTILLEVSSHILFTVFDFYFCRNVQVDAFTVFLNRCRVMFFSSYYSILQLYFKIIFLVFRDHFFGSCSSVQLFDFSPFIPQCDLFSPSIPVGCDLIYGLHCKCVGSSG